MTIEKSVREARSILDAGGSLTSEHIDRLLLYYEHHIADREREAIHAVLVVRDDALRAVFQLRSRVFALRRRFGLAEDRFRSLTAAVSEMESAVDRFSDLFDPVDREFEERVRGE